MKEYVSKRVFVIKIAWPNGKECCNDSERFRAGCFETCPRQVFRNLCLVTPKSRLRLGFGPLPLESKSRHLSNLGKAYKCSNYCYDFLSKNTSFLPCFEIRGFAFGNGCQPFYNSGPLKFLKMFTNRLQKIV